MGLPEEQINDAALKLLVSGERTITLDEGIGTSVAYIPGTEGEPRLWRSYKPENGVQFDYDPADYRLRLGGGNVSPEIQAEIARALNDDDANNDPRNVVWYAQARDSGIVVSSHAFEAIELRGVVREDGYTVHELVAHEFAHLIDRFGNNEIATKILSGDPGAWDTLINARSSFLDPNEVRPDVIASGLLNSLSANDREVFNAFLDQSFQDLEDRYGFSREVTRRSSDPY